MQNVKQLLCILLLTVFTVPGCENDSGIDSNGNQNGNGNEPKEITWQQTALDSSAISAIAADSNGQVFAATEEGIARTADKGSTWTTSELRAFVIALSVSPGGDIFAAASGSFTTGSLFRSTDGGKSWAPLDVNNYSIGPTAPVFSSSGEIFFGSAISDETGGGVFRSIDNGDTWQRTSYPDTLSAWPLAINNNGDLFAGSELGLFRSTDSGESWNLITKPEFEKRKIFTFAISRITGSIFAAVVGDGVYRSTDNGNTWQLTSLPNTNIQSLVINGSGDIFAGTGGFFSANPEGVFFSEDDGDTWQKINQGLINENILELAADSYGYVYAGTRGDGVFRTVEPTL